MARAGLAFVSGSATNASLTSGKYPTFFRAVSKDSVQGPEDANYIVKNLHPKALMIVDDQEAYSTGLVAAMTPIFTAAGITVDHESVPQTTTDFSSLVAKVTPAMTVVVLPGRSRPTPSSSARTWPRSTRPPSSSAPTACTRPARSRSTARTCPRWPGHHRDSGGCRDRLGRDGQVRVVRHVRPAFLRGRACNRRGDRLGLQVWPDAHPGQCPGGDQEHERGDLDPRAADPVRLQWGLGQRKVLPLQDQLSG